MLMQAKARPFRIRFLVGTLALGVLSACSTPPCSSCYSDARPRPGLRSEVVQLTGDQEVLPAISRERTAVETPRTYPNASQLRANPLALMTCAYRSVPGSAANEYGHELVLRDIPRSLPFSLSGSYNITAQRITTDVASSGFISFREIDSDRSRPTEVVLAELSYINWPAHTVNAHIEIRNGTDTYRVECTPDRNQRWGG